MSVTEAVLTLVDDAREGDREAAPNGRPMDEAAEAAL
jgi:hypothetical protein